MYMLWLEAASVFFYAKIAPKDLLTLSYLPASADLADAFLFGDGGLFGGCITGGGWFLWGCHCCTGSLGSAGSSLRLWGRFCLHLALLIYFLFFLTNQFSSLVKQRYSKREPNVSEIIVFVLVSRRFYNNIWMHSNVIEPRLGRFGTRAAQF